jgi:hypothetical protein
VTLLGGASIRAGLAILRFLGGSRREMIVVTAAGDRTRYPIEVAHDLIGEPLTLPRKCASGDAPCNNAGHKWSRGMNFGNYLALTGALLLGVCALYRRVF